MVSFVLAADGDSSDLIASILALVPLVDAVEKAGHECPVLIVPSTEREAELAEPIRTIEGAVVLESRRNVALAWQAGFEYALTENSASVSVFWFGSTSSVSSLDKFDNALASLQHQPYFAASNWLLAQQGALLAAGGPGRFASIEGPPESILATLIEDLPTTVAPSWKQEAASIGVSQATIDVSHPSAFEIGVESYIGRDALVRSAHAANPIRIGSYCSISGEVQILALRPRRSVFFDRFGERVEVGMVPVHDPSTATTFPVNLMAAEAPFNDIADDGVITSDPLVIGSDVWIGWGAKIVGPLKVGDGAVISAGSVVLGDVPPYSVVAGNPAQVIRTRFSATTVEKMMAIAWWNWPRSKVKANWWWFTRPVREFIKHFESER